MEFLKKTWGRREPTDRHRSLSLFRPIIIIVAVLLLFLLQTHFVHAAGFLSWISDVAYKAIEEVAYSISWLIATVAGVFIVIEAWVIGFLLDLNSHITDKNNLVVSNGFDIMLAFANLGFVLAIIVVAIATILRYEAYGFKQLIVRLIAAAILVNFSLLIAGIIINFSTALTSYFLNGFAGGTAIDFASTIASAFMPQKIFLTSGGATLNAATITAGATVGSLFMPIVGVLFTLAMAFGMVLTLFALMVMLVIRYVVLSILLVIMPIVWLAWVIPAFGGYFHKWWSIFLRWTFFAPVVVFFLWLSALVSRQTIGTTGTVGGVLISSYTTTTGSGFFGNLAKFFSAAFSAILPSALQGTVIIGLMLGGLYAANSMGIAFASTAMSWADSARKRFVTNPAQRAVNRVGRGAERTATAPIRTAPMKRLAARLQTIGEQRTGVAGVLARGAASVTGARAVGRAMESAAITGGKDAVAEARKRQKDLNTDQLAHQLPSMNAPERIAALQRLRDEKDLDKNENVHKYLDENEFRRFGSGRDYENIKNAIWGAKIQKDGAIARARARATDDAEAKRHSEEARRQRADFAITNNPNAAMAAAAAEANAQAATVRADAAERNALVEDEHGNEINAIDKMNKMAETNADGMTRADVSKSQIEDIAKAVANGKGIWGMDAAATQIYAVSALQGVIEKQEKLVSSVLGQLNKGGSYIEGQRMLKAAIEKSASENRIDNDKKNRLLKNLGDSLAADAVAGIYYSGPGNIPPQQGGNP